jgi:hypothetical protein
MDYCNSVQATERNVFIPVNVGVNIISIIFDVSLCDKFGGVVE